MLLQCMLIPPLLHKMDNIHSPYYLHSADHPTLILVSHVLTRSSNYNSQSRVMHMALSAKNKLGFVNGTITRPLNTNPNLHIRIRCNSMVLS